ncbi:type II toxin-antitoxin system Phd/YefM family antitoxin [Aliidiomarina shirensis]|uniref:Antitoxin n=1 Tax=Aliidiomarina shirensis TaxID=1048642 RepID=A0A432WWM5_9GAMM|nr:MULTISPECIES: type II toxin-antitoxin system prevent-host-death family antitoxin [Idiomarinaceae]EGN75594.1 prevent-host-death family protein [Idiomarina sp. A28L]RUO38147.1 type II toxin-antitoxin system Phd/YefM family antitoxin [Aliidiomarina shirensis]
MKTETITYLKENANSLELQEELMITKKGKPAFVVQSYADYAFQQETLALLKLMKLSEKSLTTEKLSIDEAFEQDGA